MTVRWLFSLVAMAMAAPFSAAVCEAQGEVAQQHVLDAGINRGTWGRTDSTRSGTVVFTFDTPASFTGYWTNGSSGSRTRWTGTCR